MRKTILLMTGLATLAARGEKRPSTGVEALPEGLAKPTARALTDKELAEKQGQGGWKPAPVPAKPQGYGYLEMSTVLADAEGYVVLPKGCVVILPNGLEVRQVERPSGVPYSWSEFLQKNRRWLTTEEVSMKQVRGEEILPAEKLEAARKAGQGVVAVYRGLPVTVLPPRQMVTAEGAHTTKP